MQDQVDKVAIAQLITDALLREEAAWFKRLRPVDANGTLRLRVRRDSEWIWGTHFAGTGVLPAGVLADITKVRLPIYATTIPGSRLLSAAEAFYAELQAMPQDAPVAYSSVCLRPRGNEVSVYVDITGGRVIGLLPSERVALE